MSEGWSKAVSLFPAYSRLLRISALEEAKAGCKCCQSEAMLKEPRWVEKVLPCLHLHCVKRQSEQAAIAGVGESSLYGICYVHCHASVS